MEEFEKRFFGQRTPSMKTDIREADGAYILEAELPGFAREDVSVEIKNGYMTIRAERKSDTESRDNYLRRERTYGSFSRTFDLEGINAEAITATFKDGVLSINLPKIEVKADEGRTVEIK
jgi:HSP20 family protein